MFYHLLCRVCLLCLPAFRALVTKTWSTCKNLSQSKSLKSIKHNSIPHGQINLFSIHFSGFVVVCLTKCSVSLSVEEMLRSLC